MHDKFEKMSPEERSKMREKMKEHWDSMTPEQREERRKEMHERFEKMSPEERQQIKRDMGKNCDMPPDCPAGKTEAAKQPAKK